MRVVFGPKGNTKLQPTEWTLLRLMLRVYGSAEIIRMAKWWEDDGRPWESENDWLSKEMRTPAKGFPAITDALKIGDTVELPPDLPECGGLRLRGVLISFPKFGESEVLLQIGDGPKQYIHVPTYRLVRVPE